MMCDTGDRRRTAPAAPALTALLAAALLAPAAVRAAPEGHAELRIGLVRLDYAEHDAAGAFLDGEKGFVPAIAGEVELRSGRAFGRAGARLAKGQVTYDGQTQSTGDPSVDGLPLQSTSDATFVAGELQLGAYLDPARRLALFGAAGARRWTRDLHSSLVISRTGQPLLVVGYSEIYSWYELQAGARWAFLARPKTSWDLEARVVRTAGAEISVDLAPAYGVDATARMGLGSRIGWRLGSTLRHDLQPAIFVVATLYADGYSFGHSAPYRFRDAGGQLLALAEPDSETVVAGVELGIGGRF